MAVQPPLLAIDCLEAEESLRAAGYTQIAGVDEVGRGCWAGPVYAGAVILPARCYDDRALLAEVTDSKLLTPLKRQRLARDILDLASGAAVGWADPPLVDRLNVLGATRRAMAAAIACLGGPPEAGGPGWGARRVSREPVAPDHLLVDAVKLPEVDLPQRAVIRGDSSCLAIAAASIVAKVTRDAEMAALPERYAPYDFASNKGYASRRHAHALRALGVTPLHRRSYAPVRLFIGIRDHIAGSLPA
ncbi:MAG TPA: ribonuclease HII [Chloroflexota bacterium]|nr:ribonuclease HII [Chloroflexota bacterium]